MIIAQIRNYTYQKTLASNLRDINIEELDINNSPASFNVIMPNGSNAGISMWVSPKRTRSEPFARIYNTFHLPKRITIIPIMKDEGAAGDMDRINSLTLSWMNLSNVFIILAYYNEASPHNTRSSKITKQKFDNEYIKSKIQEIMHYQLDAHHWNKMHFETDFESIFRTAMNHYQNIEDQLQIPLHNRQRDETKLNSFLENGSFSIERFIDDGVAKSMGAADREINTNHQFEIVSSRSIKLPIEITNNLGGKYYLTVDEIFIDRENNQILLRESKNSTRQILPSSGEIKDALFKMALIKNISTLRFQNQEFQKKFEIILHGNNNWHLDFPINDTTIIDNLEGINNSRKMTLRQLNDESIANGITIKIRSNRGGNDD